MAVIAGISGARLLLQDTVSGEKFLLAANGQASLYSQGAGDSMVFYTKPSGGSDTERLRIDSSGHLLLGTSTGGLTDYGDSLTIADANAGMTLRCAATTEVSHIYFADGTSSTAQYAGYVQYNHSSDAMKFGTGSVERMVLDSSGRLLVGAAAIQYHQVPFYASGTDPVIAAFHHSDGGTNDQARISLGALANNPPYNRGVNLVAENNGSGHDFVVQCSASHSAGPGEKARFKSGGDLSIADGNVVFASGHGIDFSATSDASSSESTTSMSNELFDDYEVGSWQPTWSPASGSIGYIARHGDYVKIGRTVHCMFAISANGSTSPTGELKITGLPFSATIPNANGPRGGGGVVFPGAGMSGDISKVVCSGTTMRIQMNDGSFLQTNNSCLLYTSPSPRDRQKSRMPSSA